MRLLNFNEKKKSVVCEEERKTSKLNSFFMGLYFPPYSLNSGWEKKSALITGIITFIFLKLNFGYTEEMAWGGMENTVWND